MTRPVLILDHIKGSQVVFNLDVDYFQSITQSLDYEDAIIIPVEDLYGFAKYQSRWYQVICSDVLYYDPSDTSKATADVRQKGYGFQKRKKVGDVDYESQREFRMSIDDLDPDSKGKSFTASGIRWRAICVKTSELPNIQFKFTIWLVNGKNCLKFDKISFK